METRDKTDPAFFSSIKAFQDIFVEKKFISKNLAYQIESKRDLRIDYLRGIVMCIVVLIHMDIFSLYNFLIWERIGVVSSAGGFVIMSGLLLGDVYGKKIKKNGLEESAIKITKRASQLYLTNIIITLFIIILKDIAIFNVDIVSTYKSWYSGKVYPLLPSLQQNWETIVATILTLKASPHQIQILGFYAIMLFLTPILLFLIVKNMTGILIGGSWIMYFVGLHWKLKLSGAQFENAFPLALWQVFFIHALIVGYYRDTLTEYFKNKILRKSVLIFSTCIIILCFYFAQISPTDAFPDWAKIAMPEWYGQDEYYSFKDRYFSKNRLGVLRILNYTCLFILGYFLLSKYWAIFNKLLGWFFIPLGQASLYVFIMHILILIFFAQLPGLFSVKPEYNFTIIWENTIHHTIALTILWFMVKKRFLFKYIPR